MTAYAMGQTDIAKVALKKAATAAKDFPDKDESKRRLRSLESGTRAFAGTVHLDNSKR